MKLSVRQIAVLKILAGTASAEWSRGCGWAYGGPKETDTILMSLTRHGHVERIGDEPGFTPGYLGRYRITDAGRAAVDALTTKEACIIAADWLSDPNETCPLPWQERWQTTPEETA